MHARALLVLAVVVAACSATGTPAQRGGAAMRDGTAPSATPAVAAAPAAAHRAIPIALTPAGGALWILRAGVAEASRVDVAGDFSDWDPVPLVRQGSGAWTARLRLATGVHQIALRVDGGPWVAPAGLATVTDEFGGVAGVFVVPSSSDAGAQRGSHSGEARQ